MADFLDQLRASAQAALFPLGGELTAPGLRHPVEVLRDRYGVAYISAESLDDLWFAQGFVTAGERLFQIDLASKQANGRLSELFGELTLDDDRFTRTIGINRAGATIAARMGRRLTGDASRGSGKGRSRGSPRCPPLPSSTCCSTRLPISPTTTHRGRRAGRCSRGACPGTGTSSSSACISPRSWARRRPAASSHHSAGIPRRRRPAASRPTCSSASAPASRSGFERVGDRGRQDGLRQAAPRERSPPARCSSRAPGSSSTSARPATRLAGWRHPSRPASLLGTTAHHAWGVTNVTGDVQDLYLERLNEDRTAARYEGSWEPLTVHREEIRVRGNQEPLVARGPRDPSRPAPRPAIVTGRLRPARHPLDGTYALRWVGAEHSIRPSAWSMSRTSRASRGSDDAARALECPGQNFVYADVDGTIGYQCTGLYPIRRAGDGTIPVPGWTAEHEWDGFVPFEELPSAVDPATGIPRDRQRSEPRRRLPAT